ncbi:MAG: ribulose-phosphate 3-epimerase [Clostridia bacterium]|nr:ribulose-phosphate 3-epimerase [Clostridia bacterium]
MKVKIAPSILSADFSCIGEEIKNISAFDVDYIHLDVMDGSFVNNITFGPKFIADARKYTDKPFDTHLMIEKPWKYIERFAKAGSNIITVHYEACKNKVKETLFLIKSFGCKCGLVIKPDTKVSKIKKYIPLCDMVLVMSVYPGFGGQAFIESTLNKINEVRKIVDASGKDIEIEIDGGVNRDNIKKIKEAGANVIVAGNSVFSAKDRGETIDYFKNC